MPMLQVSICRRATALKTQIRCATLPQESSQVVRQRTVGKSMPDAAA